jgi:hypothetical protein
MGDMEPGRGPKKPADLGETRRFRVHGLLTGADAPTEGERKHLQARLAVVTFATVLADERAFWRDVDAIREAIAEVDWAADDAGIRLTNPGWARSLAYGVRGRDHRVLIATVLCTAALEPTKHSARRAFLRLGERPVALDTEPRGYARRDVTRLVEGARTVAAYRAGRCGALGCRQSRQRRYCRTHGAQKTMQRPLEETRLWALAQAIRALRPPGPLSPGDHAWWLFRSRDELPERLRNEIGSS